MTQDERTKALDRMRLQFMHPEVWQGDYWDVSANHGETHIVPCDTCPALEHLWHYVDGTLDRDREGNINAARSTGWMARMSAPGYLDCTETAAFETREAAEEYLIEMYDAGEDTAESTEGAQS